MRRAWIGPGFGLMLALVGCGRKVTLLEVKTEVDPPDKLYVTFKTDKDLVKMRDQHPHLTMSVRREELSASSGGDTLWLRGWGHDDGFEQIQAGDRGFTYRGFFWLTIPREGWNPENFGGRSYDLTKPGRYRLYFSIGGVSMIGPRLRSRNSVTVELSVPTTSASAPASPPER